MSAINCFPPEIKFKYPWRPYQARVLSELETRLDDNRLHIVAAPGSGKTVLGLEVVRRLNKPALILAPTLTIRDQWVSRFVTLFLSEQQRRPELISTSLRNPGMLTVITYQALHAACSGHDEADEQEDEDEQEETEPVTEEQDANVVCEDILPLLQKCGISTIVVDEAHHLRNEWWRSLRSLRSALPNAILVALTATPPYDVTPFEWQRYTELCGPVDSEVPAPELVKEGNLCPHQDYLYFSVPSPEELKRIETFREAVHSFLVELTQNSNFTDAVANHPWLTDPKQHLESILDDPEYYSSMIIYLNHQGVRIPREALQTLGVASKRLPLPTPEWLEILLTHCLFTDRETLHVAGPTLVEIERSLRRIGAIEQRRVSLRTTRKLESSLASSLTKLDSIVDIIKSESAALSQALRLVILTDFIRAADLPKNPVDLAPLRHLGVVPIFEIIRRAKIESIRLGTLSGSLVIIPNTAHAKLAQLAEEMGIAPDGIKCTALAGDPAYLIIQVAESDQDHLVELITQLFTAGEITVLVGTKALLGEGWDAPSINCLVLASFVGTYMLSNQMRGRAIRAQSGNPNKTANIWHPICVEPGTAQPSGDFETMTRRFRAFLGVAFDRPVIENGMSRLGVGYPPFTRADVMRFNQQMVAHATDRAGLLKRWQEALWTSGVNMGPVEEIVTKAIYVPQGFLFNKTIAALFWEAIALGGFIGSQVMRGAENRSLSSEHFLLLLAIAFLVGALAAAPKLLKALWLLIRYGPVEGSMRQIGESLLKSLAQVGVIKTPENTLRVVVRPESEGSVYCGLVGGTTYEKSAYLDALQIILDPIENPRYLLTRPGAFGIFSRLDYHAVPTAIARKKEFADYFAQTWRRLVGPTNLIYTRTLEGRLILLKARSQSLSAAFRKRCERVSCWK